MTAYGETYLADAMENLGEMLDFAQRAFGITLEGFWPLFIATSYAREFEIGSPCVISGLTGAELALRAGDELGLEPTIEVLALSELVKRHATGNVGDCGMYEDGLSCAYWSGWILAYYQWASARSFSDINHFLKINDVVRMYPVFHEMSEERFVEAAEEMASRMPRQCKLKTQRTFAGLSQSQLARKSGVGLRAIQQYEQGSKDINKASAGKIFALARALHCEPKDLLDPKSDVEYSFVRLD